MTKAEAIAEAITRVKGQPLFAGAIVGYEPHPLACELLRYEGNVAVCSDGKQEHRFPRGEIFDAKKVMNVANHLLNIGYWEEGMESTVINIQTKP